MIIGQHIGRLGNNMFQIAAAIGYARKFNYRWAVDPGSGLSEPYSSIHKVFPNLPKGDMGAKLYKEHPHAWCHIHNCHYDVCHFDYHPFIDRGDSVTLFGFYQSLKYFEDVQEEIKKVFALDFYPGFEDYCSIHVRRGDYVTYSGSFPPITEEYVYQAADIIYRKTGIKKFMVFSDDIGWCREAFKKGFRYMDKYYGVGTGKEYTTIVDDFVIEYAEGNNERKDMSLMASCGHHIIANSSFSWWAGYLGHNPDKVIITPAQSGFNWFGPTGGVKNPKTLIPDGWIQISFR